MDPGFHPHGFCLNWEPWLVLSWKWGSRATALLYFVIPALLVRLHFTASMGFFFAGVHKQARVAWSFIVFVLACGVGHELDAQMLYRSDYELYCTWKVVVAVVSLGAAFEIWKAVEAAVRGWREVAPALARIDNGDPV